ncbi:MAG: hypothetical protein QOF00_509 [Pseudonocardiales bacterium]|jgi:hypothetical protein|nr:hypothetical protein [Pseudonocardiales bacterium]
MNASPAHSLLEQGTDALAWCLQPSGELNDPVFGEPAQYGTAYYAYCNAVLASLSSGAERERYADAALRGLQATLRHLLDPHDPHPPAADFSHAVGSPGFRNLRDFMWPPVMRTRRLLGELGVETGAVDEQIRAVDAPSVFSERPPVNWAAVWILGEWQRIREGLSPYDRTDIDGWLEPFFSEYADVDHGFYRELQESTGAEISWKAPIDLEKGFYREPGVPNSYDMWCRVHLLELLVEGYDGAYLKELEQLLVSGVRRSLDVQLSSGSLASAYRSTAHLWNLTGQCWYFHQAAQRLRDSHPELADEAAVAARRAFAAAQDCLRPTGDMSPVENVFPANWRVGHEVYTMDAHYVCLPLGYLATAVLEGFDGHGEVPPASDRVHVELEPVNRCLVHGSGWSVHVNLAPFAGYDSLGIADVTLGTHRRLRFGGQTHYGRPDALPDAHRLSDQLPFTLGIARRGEDRSVFPVSAMEVVGGRWAHEAGGGLEAGARVRYTPHYWWTEEVPREVTLDYRIAVTISGDVVDVQEGIGDCACSLMVPYLRERGDGHVTEVSVDGGAVRLRSADEVVDVVVDRAVDKVVHLAHGYESRHGLVGLVRLDLCGSGPVAYRVKRLA